MVSIERIIEAEVNPFDSTTFRPGNFWQEQQDETLTVESIHQETIVAIEDILDSVKADRRTRTLLLAGDSGSGKSYLLGRLKQRFNATAFFAYIGPWPESDFIWRHVLRNTVDSLMHIPDGKKESQLLLWLQSLSALRQQGFMKRVIGERQFFIQNLKGSYPSGIYNPNEFFGVLYDLTNPNLYPIACEWLKGDNLDKKSLKTLRVKSPIDSEEVARKIMANFGIISSATQPIVLCFDNLDNIDRALDGFINLQALFTLNSIIHNQKLKNFLVIISIVTNTWEQNSKRVQPADIARINLRTRLPSISLDLAEDLWASRLKALYKKASAQPPTPIYPLTRKHLEAKFPGGKARPRYVLMLGRQLFQAAKTYGIEALMQLKQESDRGAYPNNGDRKASLQENARASGQKNPVGGALTKQIVSGQENSSDPIAAFQLLWLKEFNKSQAKIARIRQFSAPELIQMLREALEALEVKGIQTKVLPSPKYASYSLSYHLPVQLGRIGVVWTEDPNLISFFHVMKASKKALAMRRCKILYMIRAERLGTHKNQGNKIYSQIFTGHPHRHLLPDLTSVQYLATYHSLVNAACAGELVVGDRIPSLRELQALIRSSKILEACSLLDALGIFRGYLPLVGVAEPKKLGTGRDMSQQLKMVKDYLLALVKTQQMMGRHILMQNALDQFPEIQEYQASELIFQLCQEQKILIIDDTIPVESQLVCLMR